MPTVAYADAFELSLDRRLRHSVVLLIRAFNGAFVWVSPAIGHLWMLRLPLGIGADAVAFDDARCPANCYACLRWALAGPVADREGRRADIAIGDKVVGEQKNGMDFRALVEQVPAVVLVGRSAVSIALRPFTSLKESIDYRFGISVNLRGNHVAYIAYHWDPRNKHTCIAIVGHRRGYILLCGVNAQQAIIR
jgi:hypothetical protein